MCPAAMIVVIAIFVTQTTSDLSPLPPCKMRAQAQPAATEQPRDNKNPLAVDQDAGGEARASAAGLPAARDHRDRPHPAGAPAQGDQPRTPTGPVALRLGAILGARGPDWGGAHPACTHAQPAAHSMALDLFRPPMGSMPLPFVLCACFVRLLFCVHFVLFLFSAFCTFFVCFSLEEELLFV